MHLYYNTPTKKDSISENKAEQIATQNEIEADRIGFYAMSRAGYQPEQVRELFDAITHNKGQTGNWFTDVVGTTGQNMAALPH